MVLGGAQASTAFPSSPDAFNVQERVRVGDPERAPRSPELSARGAKPPSLPQNTTATARKEKRGKNSASSFLSHHPVFPIWSFFSVSGSQPPKRSLSSWIAHLISHPFQSASTQDQ